MSSDIEEYNFHTELDIIIRWFTQLLAHLSEKEDIGLIELFNQWKNQNRISKSGFEKLLHRFSTYNDEEIKNIMECWK